MIPKKFGDVLRNVKENSHKWCISRQLWWGHKIPALYHKNTGEIFVGENGPSDEENWEKENDVLDTWFSSGLWPLISLSNEKSDFIFHDYEKKCYL